VTNIAFEDVPVSVAPGQSPSKARLWMVIHKSPRAWSWSCCHHRRVESPPPSRLDHVPVCAAPKLEKYRPRLPHRSNLGECPLILPQREPHSGPRVLRVFLQTLTTGCCDRVTRVGINNLTSPEVSKGSLCQRCSV
jgi:hypothetical protein